MWRRFLHNNPTLKVRRRELRQHITPAELVLWEQVRNNRLGFKFRRQYSFGSYILDFYCPEKCLGIEIDGRVHLHQQAMDEYRTITLEQYDIRIIRFSNDEVINNTNQVLNTIKEYLL